MKPVYNRISAIYYLNVVKSKTKVILLMCFFFGPKLRHFSYIPLFFFYFFIPFLNSSILFVDAFRNIWSIIRWLWSFLIKEAPSLLLMASNFRNDPLAFLARLSNNLCLLYAWEREDCECLLGWKCGLSFFSIPST